MITKSILEDNDYKEFKSITKDNNIFYQKCIKDELGKKYFININYFNIELENGKNHNGWEIKVQFQNIIINKKEITKNVTYFGLPEDIKIEELEELIEKDWKSLGKPYYQKYGE